MEIRNVYEVSGNGPWTVGVVSVIREGPSSRSTVALAYTSDGTHPSATLHKAAAAIIESYKASGALP